MSKKKEYINKNESKDQKLIAIQKESIIKIQDYMDKFVVIKFLGGRQVQGKLKSCDPANNIILSDCIEFLRDIKDPYKLTGDKRDLGCVVIRGSMFLTISPLEGMEEIENPFLQQGIE